MIKKDRPEYEALALRIKSGELNRKQASEIAKQQTGLSAATFLVWLSQQKLDLPHGNTQRNSHATNDPDKAVAYATALEAVSSGKMTGSAAAKRFGVNYTYLMRLANERRRAANPEPPESRALADADRELIQQLIQSPVRLAKLAGVVRALGI